MPAPSAIAVLEQMGPDRPIGQNPHQVRDPGSTPARQRDRTDLAGLETWEVEALREVVSQQELEALHALEQERREIDAELKLRRRRILDRLDLGCSVQPGRYQVRRKASRRHRLTFAALAECYDAEFVRDLKERLGTVESVRLEVRAAGGDRSPRGTADYTEALW
jgi:hypothetical protein